MKIKNNLLFSFYLVSFLTFGQKKLYVDKLTDFQNGYSIVSRGNITSFIDSLGVELELDSVRLKLSTTGSNIGMLENGLFINQKVGYSLIGNEGIRNTNGDYIVQPNFSITNSNGYYILIDRSEILNIKYEVLDKNCKSIFKISGSLGSNNIPIIPLTDNIIAITNKNSYPYRYKLKFIYENKETEYNFNDFGRAKNGLIKASKYNEETGSFKWGYLDEEGNTVIDFLYTHPLGDFEDNLAVVKNIAGKFGYINLKNELIIDTKFVEAYGFVNNRAIVRVHKYKKIAGKLNNGYRIINKNGEIIYDFEDLKPIEATAYRYFNITGIEENSIIRVNNSKSKKYLLNLDNQKLIGKGFLSLNKFNSGLAFVKFIDDSGIKNEGFINKEGELIYLKSQKSQF